MAATPAAIIAAARMAEYIAIQTDTALIVPMDGKPVRVTAEELRARRLRDVNKGIRRPEFDLTVGGLSQNSSRSQRWQAGWVC